jgi:hypothetical protein
LRSGKFYTNRCKLAGRPFLRPTAEKQGDFRNEAPTSRFFQVLTVF